MTFRLAALTGALALFAIGCTTDTTDPSPDAGADASSDGGVILDGGGEVDVLDPDADVLEPDAEPDAGDVPPDTELPPADADDADGGEADSDGGPAPVEPALAMAFGTADGTVGDDPSESLLFYPEAEPEAYLASPDFQVDVVVDAFGLAGRTVRLFVGDEEVAAQGVSEDATTELGAELLFEGVTLGGAGTELPGTVEVRVEATTVDGAEVGDARNVDVEVLPCDVAVTAGAPAPVEEDTCLTGGSGQVYVSLVGGGCDSVTVTLDAGEGPVEVGTDTFAEDGTATFAATFDPSGEGFEGTVTVTATATHPESAGLTGAATATYQVDTIAPVITLAKPDPTLTTTVSWGDDEDEEVDGLQYGIVGTVTEVADDAFDAVAFTITGGAGESVGGTTTPTGGAFAFPAATWPYDGSVTLTVTATDACGNVGSAKVELTVFTTAPTVAFAAPAAGSVLFAKDDADPETSTLYETDVSLATTGLAEGHVVAIACRPAASTGAFVEAGSVTIEAGTVGDDGALTVPVAVDVFGGAEQVCRTEIDAQSPIVGEPVALTFAIPAPTLSLEAPVDGAVLGAGAISFTGEATGLDGRWLSIGVTPDGADTTTYSTEFLAGGLIADGLFDVALTFDASIPDGSGVLTVDATDAYGNVVSDTSDPIALAYERDSLPPTLAKLVPAGSTLTPYSAAADVDEDPETEGYQTTILVQASGEDAPDGVTVCLAIGAAEPVCVGTDEAFTAAFVGVTLSPGPNAVVITATDAAGNAAEPLADTLVVDLDAPAVGVVAPADGTITSAGAVDIQATVSVPGEGPSAGESVADAAVVLWIDGEPAPELGATYDAGTGTFTFADVALAEGDTTFQVQALFSSVGGVSATVTVTRKSDAPVVTVTAPVDGTTFAVGAPACLGAVVNCFTDVVASVTGAAEGDTAELTVTCGDDEATYPSTLTAEGTVTFEGVPFAHGETCTAAVAVTDAADNVGTSEAITVAVDRVGPAFDAADPALGLPIFHTRDVVPAEEGEDPVMNAIVTVGLSGVEAGAVVTLTLTPAEGPETAVTATVTDDIADDVIALVTFEDAPGVGSLTLADGFVDAEFTVADAAGNAASLQGTWEVYSSPPTVTVLGPPSPSTEACAAETPCADGAVCEAGAGTCHLAWGADATATLTAVAQDTFGEGLFMRVCSDNPVLSGSVATACDVPGTFEVASQPYGPGQPVTFDLSGAPQGFQSFHVEAQQADGIANAISATSLRVYHDTVAPALDSVGEPPAGPGGVPTFTLAQDVDPGQGGVQVVLSGTVSGFAGVLGETLTVTVTDADGGETTPAVDFEGTTWQAAPVTFTVDGPVTVAIVATDAAGNTDTFDGTWAAAVTPVTATILTPGDGVTLLAADDSVPVTADAFDTVLTAQVTPVAEGDVLTLLCTPAGDTLPVVAGTFEVDADLGGEGDVFVLGVSIPLGEDASKQTTCVLDVQAVNPATSAPVTYTVALPGPTLTVTSPVDGTVSTTHEVTFSGVATGLANQVLEIDANGVLSTLTLPATDGPFSETLDVAAVFGVEQGAVTFSFASQDVFGNEAPGVGTRTVTFETEAPEVLQLLPAVATLDPTAGEEFVDQNPGLPGYQTVFQFQMVDTSLEGAVLCLTVGGADLGCETVDAAGLVTWDDVTLSAGDTAVFVTAVDGVGLVGGPFDFTTTLLLDAPVVTLVEPASATITADPTATVVAEITAPWNGAPLDGASVSLLAGGEDTGVTPTGLGDGVFVFAGVPLVADTEVVFQVVAEFSSVEGASGPVSVTYKTASPAVVIDTPSDDLVVTASFEGCSEGTFPDCLLSVEATVTDAEPTAEATLTVACGEDSLSQASLSVGDGFLQFPPAPFVQGSVCLATVSVTDLAGQVAVSDPTVVTVDRVAPSVTLTAPADGLTLLFDADADPQSAGLQALVQASVEDAQAGQTVVLEISGEGSETVLTATLTADAPAGFPQDVTFESSVDSGLVDLADGEFTLTVSATDTVGNVGSDAATVTVAGTEPSLAITAPAAPGTDCAACGAGNLCVGGSCAIVWNASATRELTYDVAVALPTVDNLVICSNHASLASGGTPCAAAGTFVVATADAVGGEVAVDVSGAPEGVQTLHAELAWFPGESALTHVDTEQARRVYIDTLAPSVDSLVAPPTSDAVGGLPLLTLANDGDGEPSNGLNVTVSGQTSGLMPFMDLSVADSVSVSVDDGQGPVAVSPESTGDFAAAGFVFTQDGPVTLTVTATDPAGNTGSLTQTWYVAATTPDIDFELEGEAREITYTVNDDDDDTTAAVLDTVVAFSFASTALGTTVTLACRPDGAPASAAVEVGSVTISSGFSETPGVEGIQVSLDTTTFGQFPRCTLSADSLNAVETDDVTLRIGIPAPTLTVDAPTAGTGFGSGAVAVVLSAGGLDGQPVSATLLADGSVVGTALSNGTVSGGALSETFDFGAVADGSYEVLFDGTDVFGNTLSVLGASPSVTVTVDGTGPALELVGPLTTLVPLTDPELTDEAPEVLGFQGSLFVVAEDAGVGGGQACAVFGGTDLGCVAVDDGGLAVFTGVTIPDGTTALTLDGTDSLGNAAAQVSASVTADLARPTVTLTTPATDGLVAEGTVSVTATVTEPIPDGPSITVPGFGTPLSGMTATVFVDGVAQAIAATDGGDGTYTFTDVPLVADTAVALTVRAGRNGVEATSDARTLTWKTSAPSATITSPTTGTVLTQASTDVCAGTAEDCTLDVTVTTANVENGQMATLTVDCGEPTVATFMAAVESDAVTFSNAVIAHGGTCSLAVSVTDLAGQEATSSAISVTVDRREPEFGAFTPTGGTTLIYLDDINTAVEGMQTPFLVRVGGVEAGQVLTVTAAWTDEVAGPQTKEWNYTFPADVAEGTTPQVSLEDVEGTGFVTFPEGVVTITATATDAAGNVGTANTSYTVESNAPSVTITSPVALAQAVCDVSTPCAEGVCIDDVCHDTWGALDSRQLVAFTAGLLTTTNNLRVCSDHPDLATGDANACQTSGYFEVATTSTSGGVSLLNLSSAPEGKQTFIAELLWQVGEAYETSLEAAAGFQSRPFLIDLVTPTVSAVASPSDTLPPSGTLSAAEISGAANTFEITVTASEDGTAELFVDGVSDQTFAISGGSGTATVVLGEGLHTLWARVTDSVGNTGASFPAAGVPSLTVTVDTVAPTLAFTQPTSSPLIAGDALSVTLASDGDGLSVELFDGGVSQGAGTVVGGEVSFGALSEGDHTLTATVTDAAGNSTTVATSPTTITVDTVPPSGSITSPAAATILTDADDADGADGYQVAIAFTTADGATSWALDVADGCTDAFAGCGPAAEAASGSVTNAGGAEPTALVTIALDPGVTYKLFTLETTDANGNTATSSVGVQFVNLTCGVVVTGLPSGSFVASADCGAGAGCPLTLTATISGVGCTDIDTFTLFDGASEVATISGISGGTADFDVNVSDGASLSYTVEAYVDSVEVAEGGPFVRTVDLTAPAVTLTPVFAGTLDAADSYNASNDISGVLSGFQLDATVGITDTNATDGRIVSIVADAGGGGSPLSPSNVSLPLTIAGGSPVSQGLFDLTLTDLATSTVTVTVEDAAGNSATQSFTATVDTVAPDAVVFRTIDTSTDVDARQPAVTLAWTDVGDDGATGTADRVELRYSWSPIDDEADFDAACALSDLEHTAAFPAPAVGGTTTTYTVSGPDPRAATDPCKFVGKLENDSLTTVYFAIRARDDAGNWSDLASGSKASAELISYRVKRIDFAGTIPSFGTAGGAAVGDYDGDGRDDLVAGFFFANNNFCLLLGQDFAGSELLASSIVDGSLQCVTSAGDVLTGATSAATHILPLGDVNGDGFDDFGVGGSVPDPDDSTTTDYVAVYLGRAGTPDLSSPNVVIRGSLPAAGAAYFYGFSGAGNFNGDTSAGGLPIDDIVVGSPQTGVNRVFVVPGQESWDPSTTSLEINVRDSAELTANNVLTFHGDLPVGTNPPWFGIRTEPAGDVLPTPDGDPTACDDILVHQSGQADARIFVIPGRPWTGAPELTLTDLSSVPSAEDDNGVRLRQESAGQATGFGTTIQGGKDVTGDGVPDVVVAHTGHAPTGTTPTFDAAASSVYVFDGSNFASAVGGDLRIGLSGGASGNSFRGTNGYVFAADMYGDLRNVAVVGNYDGWVFGTAPTNDIAIVGSDQSTWTFHQNHETLDGAYQLGMYPNTDTVGADPDAPYAGGFWLQGDSDLTGDGKPDIVFGTFYDELVIFY